MGAITVWHAVYRLDGEVWLEWTPGSSAIWIRLFWTNKVPARARFGDAVLQDFDKLAHACFAIHAFGR